MPIPWLAIAAVAGAGASLYGQYQAKPVTPTKPKSMYKANTKAMERYISYLKGRRATRDVYRSAMEPALRTIGKSAAKTRRDISSQAVRSGLSGSGIEMQGKLSARQQELGALQDISTEASTLQAQQNQAIGSEMAKASGQILAEEIRGENVVRAEENAWQARLDQHEQNLANWEGQMWQAGGQLISSGISAYGQFSQMQTASQSAKAYAESYGGEGAYDRMIQEGFTDADILSRYKGMESETIKQIGNIDFGGNISSGDLDDMYNDLSGLMGDEGENVIESAEASPVPELGTPHLPAPPVRPEVPVEVEEEFAVSPIEYEDPDDRPPAVRQAVSTEVIPDEKPMDDFGNVIPTSDADVATDVKSDTTISDQAFAQISKDGTSKIVSKRIEGAVSKVEEAIRLTGKIEGLSRREKSALKKFGISITGKESAEDLIAIRAQINDIINNLSSM